jgi:hypothetical protein
LLNNKAQGDKLLFRIFQKKLKKKKEIKKKGMMLRSKKFERLDRKKGRDENTVLVLPRKSFFLLIAFNRKWKQVYKLV